MSMPLGTQQRSFRLAIIGSGPSGCYAADALLKKMEHVQIDVYDRLPVPYGLVRYGVAPDHIKIKNVTKVFAAIFKAEQVRFMGNIQVGQDVSVDELKGFYDAVLFAYGAETDHHLGIPGEGLIGSHTATQFVAWYNGHPDCKDLKFDLTGESAFIIGQGNVAMDVCRILAKTPQELAQTDIAAHALEQLRENQIKNIYMVGRRGPMQAAFTYPELKELRSLTDCQVVIADEDLVLNPSSQMEYDDPKNNLKRKSYDLLKTITAETSVNSSDRRLMIQFLRSPVAFEGDGRLQRIVWQRNQLTGEAFQQKASGTDEIITMEAGIVFRSVGYRGVSIVGVPFNEERGVIPNAKGRVLEDVAQQAVVPGLYTAGWIKRGPNGVIGTNKADAEETVACLLEDVNQLSGCPQPSSDAVDTFLQAKGLRVVTFNDWCQIDAAEVAAGQKVGKPREKFTRIDEMLAVLDGSSATS